MSPLVRAGELAGELASGAVTGRAPRVLDVRWRLDRPEGRIDYLEGHIPGAVFVDLERELAAPGRPEAGRHPLPAEADFRAAVRRWGIAAGDRVVVYDDNDAVPAARAWWLLRQYGVDVRVLDGGLRSWLRHGLRLERGDVSVRPSRWEGAPPRTDAVASIDDAALAPQVGVLVDVRAPQHYRGAVPGLDPAAGHIPGAINLPTVTHISPEGLLRRGEAIGAQLAHLGIGPDDEVVLYDGSGIASMHSALAFTLAGYRPRVFVGSWSQWARSEGRPVAVGPSPAGTIVAAY
ncbi:sulfurtransferase [Microbacterium sp.]|uniref:sulfurtransferase n=1 Tax=Microbacterium sp. TaxID=51671 RepID=UPI0039E592C1